MSKLQGSRGKTLPKSKMKKNIDFSLEGRNSTFVQLLKQRKRNKQTPITYHFLKQSEGRLQRLRWGHTLADTALNDQDVYEQKREIIDSSTTRHLTDDYRIAVELGRKQTYHVKQLINKEEEHLRVGVTIALESHSGGYLMMKENGEFDKCSDYKLTSNATFTFVDLSDSFNTSKIGYGDPICLQVDKSHVLATYFKDQRYLPTKTTDEGLLCVLNFQANENYQKSSFIRSIFQIYSSLPKNKTYQHDSSKNFQQICNNEWIILTQSNMAITYTPKWGVHIRSTMDEFTKESAFLWKIHIIPVITPMLKAISIHSKQKINTVQDPKEVEDIDEKIEIKKSELGSSHAKRITRMLTETLFLDNNSNSVKKLLNKNNNSVVNKEDEELSKDDIATVPEIHDAKLKKQINAKLHRSGSISKPCRLLIGEKIQSQQREIQKCSNVKKKKHVINSSQRDQASFVISSFLKRALPTKRNLQEEKSKLARKKTDEILPLSISESLKLLQVYNPSVFGRVGTPSGVENNSNVDISRNGKTFRPLSSTYGYGRRQISRPGTASTMKSSLDRLNQQLDRVHISGPISANCQTNVTNISRDNRRPQTAPITASKAH